METEVSLEEIISIFKKKYPIILLWSIVGILFVGVYTFFLANPIYESTSRIVVNQTQNTNQNITNADIQTNLNLINTYQSIIKEPIILEDVINKTDTGLSVNQLSSKIAIQIQNDSLVFGISVSDENPYIAAELANAVATSFEEKIGDILEVQSVTILSEAVPNLGAVSPKPTINLILGLLVGMMFGVILGFLTEYMDKRVKDNKIIEDLNWTNLGSVLEMSTNEIIETRIDKKDSRNTRNTFHSMSKRRA